MLHHRQRRRGLRQQIQHRRILALQAVGRVEKDNLRRDSAASASSTAPFTTVARGSSFSDARFSRMVSTAARFFSTKNRVRARPG